MESIELLMSCREIFRNLGRDTVVDTVDMHKICIDIDNYLEKLRKLTKSP